VQLELKGEGAVVTGAASGIGKAIATGVYRSGRERLATIVIDGGSLTRGYPALLTGLRKP
jgi:NAD(P)-dependent dehydrogenase (short-subunit alcohol dehydrogenase family)